MNGLWSDTCFGRLYLQQWNMSNTLLVILRCSNVLHGIALYHKLEFYLQATVNINMTKQTTSILKLAGTTAVIFLTINLLMGGPSSDIHVHDSYIIMSTATKIILFIVFSVFVGSLTVAILSKFKNKLYNKVLLFSLLLLVSASMYIFSLFADLK